MLLSTLKNLAVLLALGSWSSSHSLLTSGSAMKPSGFQRADTLPPSFLDPAASSRQPSSRQPSSRQPSDHVAAPSEAGSSSFSLVDSLDLWERVDPVSSVGTSWVFAGDGDVAKISDLDEAPHVTLIYVLWDISGSTNDYWKAAFDYLPRMVSDFVDGPQSVGKKYPETKMLLTLDCFHSTRSKKLDWVDMRLLKTEIVHAPFRREAALPVVVPGSANWEEVAALPDEERKMWVGFEGNLAGLAWDAENEKHYVPRKGEWGAAGTTKNQGWFVPDMTTR